jgi:uncharacterized membrane protein YvbJ
MNVATTDVIQCPKCGHANSTTAHFCTSCHAMLIRRCPNCWHEQREGLVCEKCGTCFALAAELALEKSMNEEARVQRDKAVARALTVWQIALLPFTSFAGMARALAMRLFAGLLNR